MGDVGHGSRHPLQHAPELWVRGHVLGASQISDVWVHEEQRCPGSPVHAQSPCCAHRKKKKKKKRFDQKLSRYNLLTFSWTLLNIQKGYFRWTSDTPDNNNKKKDRSRVKSSSLSLQRPTQLGAMFPGSKGGTEITPPPTPPTRVGVVWFDWQISTHWVTWKEWKRMNELYCGWIWGWWIPGRDKHNRSVSRGLERARPHTWGVRAGLLPTSLWCPEMNSANGKFQIKTTFPTPLLPVFPCICLQKLLWAAPCNRCRLLLPPLWYNVI